MHGGSSRITAEATTTISHPSESGWFPELEPNGLAGTMVESSQAGVRSRWQGLELQAQKVRLRLHVVHCFNTVSEEKFEQQGRRNHAHYLRRLKVGLQAQVATGDRLKRKRIENELASLKRGVAAGEIIVEHRRGRQQQVPLWQQGNVGLSTQENMSTRSRLRFDEGVLRVLDEWWSLAQAAGCCTVDTEEPTLTREGYVKIFVRIHRILLEEWDSEAAEALVAEEWEKDLRESTAMHRELFFDALFELADVWTPLIDAAGYAKFLRDLLFGIAGSSDGVVGSSDLRQIDAISFSATLANEGGRRRRAASKIQARVRAREARLVRRKKDSAIATVQAYQRGLMARRRAAELRREKLGFGSSRHRSAGGAFDTIEQPISPVKPPQPANAANPSTKQRKTDTEELGRAQEEARAALIDMEKVRAAPQMKARPQSAFLTRRPQPAISPPSLGYTYEQRFPRRLSSAPATQSQSHMHSAENAMAKAQLSRQSIKNPDGGSSTSTTHLSLSRMSSANPKEAIMLTASLARTTPSVKTESSPTRPTDAAVLSAKLARMQVAEREFVVAQLRIQQAERHRQAPEHRKPPAINWEGASSLLGVKMWKPTLKESASAPMRFQGLPRPQSSYSGAVASRNSIQQWTERELVVARLRQQRAAQIEQQRVSCHPPEKRAQPDKLPPGRQEAWQSYLAACAASSMRPPRPGAGAGTQVPHTQKRACQPRQRTNAHVP